jgi:hypothetical protein
LFLAGLRLGFDSYALSALLAEKSTKILLGLESDLRLLALSQNSGYRKHHCLGRVVFGLDRRCSEIASRSSDGRTVMLSAAEDETTLRITASIRCSSVSKNRFFSASDPTE